MTSQFGLKEATIQSIRNVLEQYPKVEKATLYGSRAMGRYKIGSDIDLTLHGGPSLTLTTLFKIMDDMDELLLPYTLDLSIYHTIHDDDLLDHINRVGVVFYERNAPHSP